MNVPAARGSWKLLASVLSILRPPALPVWCQEPIAQHGSLFGYFLLAELLRFFPALRAILRQPTPLGSDISLPPRRIGACDGLILGDSPSLAGLPLALWPIHSQTFIPPHSGSWTAAEVKPGACICGEVERLVPPGGLAKKERLSPVFEVTARHLRWRLLLVARQPEEVDRWDCQVLGINKQVCVVLHTWWSYQQLSGSALPE
mmetsp:Transcript_3999/g.7263  ORF Transcript_3999/g.7263 Transcript_3999/m.7263 type:complete len:203 (+) Transcript_3999:176-784(+)